MWLSQQLSLDRKKAFVSGFARESYGSLIPTDLIKILRWYADEVLYWSMEGKFLRKFCSKKVGQILYSSTFNFNEIEFCCYWYPNGNSATYANQTIFGVTLCHFPANIESITIYYRLHCRKFDCLWKSIHTFRRSASSFNNCIGWNPFNMKLSECKKHTQLDFNCYVKVLRVLYQKGDRRQIDAATESAPHEQFRQMTKFQWMLSRQRISDCVHCEVGKTFYSDNFGGLDNWCLFVAPKGFAERTENSGTEHLMLYLRLLRLPVNIATMAIRCQLKATYTLNSNLSQEHRAKETRLVRLGYGFSDCTKQCLADRIPNIVRLASLCIDIRVEVTEMVDMNDKAIPRSQWPAYGLIANDGLSRLTRLFSQ